MEPEAGVGRRSLVTGSTRGVGLGIVDHLLSAGWEVAVNGRTSARVLEVAANRDGAVAAEGDVSDPSAACGVVEAASQALGGLDLVVCNVGGGSSVAPGSETPEEWQRVFALNLWSATNVVEASRSVLAEGGGSVVCISSICGSVVVPGAPVTYSVAKAALHAYVRGMATPLAGDGVRINAVALGNILHDDSVWATLLDEDPSSVEAMLEREVPLARLGRTEDVGPLVEYLGSSRSAFATGAVWTLDGGQSR